MVLCSTDVTHTTEYTVRRTLACFGVGPLLLLSLLAAPVAAQNRSGDFGLGIIVGDPTGVVVKYFASEAVAFDAAIGGRYWFE